MDECFVVTAPGLEPLVAAEMRAIGLRPAQQPAAASAAPELSEESGGVSFTGSVEDIWRANLLLRVAGRVLVRLGDFNAVGFDELRKKAGRLAWERFLFPNQPVNLRVTCHKSRLYHSGAVAERVQAAIGDRLGKMIAPKAHARLGKNLPPLLVVVRFAFDHCTISVDSSGELLHRRGYRLETAKAPLRETLAAGLLLASGWDRRSPLLDPFCGSGTIPIEAALLALGRPPGLIRQFAFMTWPGFDRSRWEALLAVHSASTLSSPARLISSPIFASPSFSSAPSGDSETSVSTFLSSIQGSDRDEGAVRIAGANAARAGVGDQIRFSHRAVSAVQPPPGGPGWIVTNPPYGQRVSPGKDLRDLYARFGAVLRERFPGWRVAILSSDLRLLGQLGFPLDTSLTTVNGGIAVRLALGSVPA